MGKGQAWADHPLSRALTVAIGSGALWWSLDEMSTVNGVGWLTRSGPPWSWVGLFVAIGAGVGGAIGLRSRSRSRAHSRAVEERTRALGFAYQERADDLFEHYPEAAAMPVFRDRHSVVNRATGEIRGATVEVFDLTGQRNSESSEGDSTTTTTRQTLVFLPGADLPDFELRAKGMASRAVEALGVEGMTFDVRTLACDDARAVEAFLRLYRLNRLEVAEKPIEMAPGDDLAVRRVFSAEVMRLLVARPGWSAQSYGGRLAFWRGSARALGTLTINGLAVPLGRGGELVPADDRAALVDDALAITDAMNAAAQRPASSPVVPAVPVGTLAAQHARARGAILSGSAGGILGFFIGIGLFAAWMFSRTGVPGLPKLLCMPLLAVGGSALGGLVGALLGHRFLPIAAEHAPPPSFRRPPAPGAWPVLGVIAGFLLGGGADMAWLILMQGAPLHTWLFPILFFGGAGGGAGLGLIVGGLIAFSRLRRRKQSPSA
jgi:hypothetical protein